MGKEHNMSIDDIKKDIIAFFDILEFYKIYRPNCLDAIKYAQKQDFEKADDPNIQNLWNQIGDSLWKTIPKLDSHIQKMCENNDLSNIDDANKILENLDETIISEFYKDFNNLLMHLALAIRLTNSINSLEIPNQEKTQFSVISKIVNDLNTKHTTQHPIVLINKEITKIGI